MMCSDHRTAVACCTAAALSAILVQSPADAGVVRVETSLEGIFLLLVEIEIAPPAGTGQVGRTIPYERLIPTSVLDFRSVNESNAANTVTVLGTPAAVPPEGADRLRLVGDPYLNTGVFNPSYGTPGLHVVFDAPVRNGPGVDVVLFELTIGSGQTPDPIEVWQPEGAGVPLNAMSHDYHLQGAFPPGATLQTYNVTVAPNSSADLAHLRDATLATAGQVSNPKWHAIGIDLDHLGVPAWGSVLGLQILSDNIARNTPVDVLMVVGLRPAYWPGDFDGDHAADGADFLVWQREFGGQFGGPADANGDQIVDAGDLVVWSQYYGGGSASVVATAVPEPDAGAIAACFLAICALLRIRCWNKWADSYSRRSANATALTVARRRLASVPCRLEAARRHVIPNDLSWLGMAEGRLPWHLKSH